MASTTVLGALKEWFLSTPAVKDLVSGKYYLDPAPETTTAPFLAVKQTGGLVNTFLEHRHETYLIELHCFAPNADQAMPIALAAQSHLTEDTALDLTGCTLVGIWLTQPATPEAEAVQAPSGAIMYDANVKYKILVSRARTIP